MTGEKLLAAIKQDSVGPFHFDEEYGLSEEEVSIIYTYSDSVFGIFSLLLDVLRHVKSAITIPSR